jgi:hypothetical protein
MELDFGFGKKTFTPLAEPLVGSLEFVKEQLTRLHMATIFIPSIVNHIQEPRHLEPKVFEAEGLGSFRSTIICKEEWTMVGKGG